MDGDVEGQMQKLLAVEQVDISPHYLQVTVDTVLNSEPGLRQPYYGRAGSSHDGAARGVAMGWDSVPEGGSPYLADRPAHPNAAADTLKAARGPLAAWNQSNAPPLDVDTFMREVGVPEYSFPERALGEAMAQPGAAGWSRQRRLHYQQREPPDPNDPPKGRPEEEASG